MATSSDRLWVMIAGPYRSGAASELERSRNLLALNEAAVAVLDKGHIPVIGVNLALPIIEAAGRDRYDEIMMPLSLAIASRCDAILRVGGDSTGADDEVECVRARAGSVYSRASDLPDYSAA